MNEVNRKVYDDPEVVHEYAQAVGLHAGERAILDLIALGLNRMWVLDIGVGGGRTTEYLATKAARYFGIDYSAAMIEACRERFANYEAASFLVRDVRDLRGFKDAIFDFALFSYNGIDYLDHSGRVEALLEVRRVMKLGGVFAFSAHNCASLADLATVNWQQALQHPLSFLQRFWFTVRIRALNRDLNRIAAEGSGIVNDGARSFRLRTFYSSMTRQVRELESCRFASVRVFDMEGQEIPGPYSDQSTSHAWLYYLCEAV